MVSSIHPIRVQGEIRGKLEVESKKERGKGSLSLTTHSYSNSIMSGRQVRLHSLSRLATVRDFHMICSSNSILSFFIFIDLHNPEGEEDCLYRIVAQDSMHRSSSQQILIRFRRLQGISRDEVENDSEAFRIVGQARRGVNSKTSPFLEDVS